MVWCREGHRRRGRGRPGRWLAAIQRRRRAAVDMTSPGIHTGNVELILLLLVDLFLLHKKCSR
jgi:hypothetical protein